MKNSVIISSNEDIVHVDEEPSSNQLMDEQVIHHMLKNGRRIAQAEEYNCQFKQSIFHDKHSFSFMFFSNADIVVTCAYVHFCEQLFSFQFVNQIGNAREGVGVDGPFIDKTIILTGLFISRFLLNKEER